MCLHTQRAARTLARRFDEAFAPLDLTNGQFSLLMSLNRADSPSMGAVARVLAMDRTTLTAALKPLERRGLVWVESDAEDQRVRRLSLTEAGTDALSMALPIWRQAHGTAESMIGGASADAFRSALRAVS